jgi:hypothetical protein
MTARRVSVYIDGFNLYHALDDLGESHLKWLDLWALSETLIRKNEAVTTVKYFSAYATWMPASYRRHQRYVAALQAQGVQFIEGRFKEKPMQCKSQAAQIESAGYLGELGVFRTRQYASPLATYALQQLIEIGAGCGSTERTNRLERPSLLVSAFSVSIARVPVGTGSHSLFLQSMPETSMAECGALLTNFTLPV